MKIGKAMKYNIVIEPSGNMGFIVSVGCAKFVFESHKVMTESIKEYLDNPEKAEKEYGKCYPSAPEQDRNTGQQLAAQPTGNPFAR